MRSNLNLLARWILSIQLLLALLISLSFFIILSNKAGASALLAGATALIPNIVFAKKMFQSQTNQMASKIVKNFYQAEVLKLMTTVILFTAVFRTFKISPVVFFLTYMGLQWLYWLIMLLPNFKK